MRDRWGPVWPGMMHSQKKTINTIAVKRSGGQEPSEAPSDTDSSPSQTSTFLRLTRLSSVDSTRSLTRHYFSWLCYFTRFMNVFMDRQHLAGLLLNVCVGKSQQIFTLSRVQESGTLAQLLPQQLVWYRAKHTTAPLQLTFCLNCAFVKQTNEISGS